MRSQQEKARRRQDEKARDVKLALTDEKHAMSKAFFEISTTKKLEARAKQEMLERVQREQEVSLLRRRQELSDLYNFERETWDAEVLNNVESVEDRKKKMMDRAYALREKREKERLEFVKQCYDNQWRDACDDARTLDSKAMVAWVDAQNQEQIQEKNREMEELAAAENQWIESNKMHNEKLDDIEREKNELRAKAAKDLEDGLQKQMEENERLLTDELERIRIESEKELRECRAAIAAEEAKQLKLKEDAVKNGRDVFLFNEKYKDARKEEEALERMQEARLLAYHMRKEAAEIATEEAKKQANKKAAQMYRKYLEEMMIKDAEDNTGLDEIRKREENKIWDARDAMLQARQDARDYLMKTVVEGNQEMIALKKQQLLQEKENANIYSNQFLQDAAEGVAREKAEIQRRRMVAEENNQKLIEQIEFRRQQIEQAKQDQYLETKRMEHIEKLHRQKLTEQAGKVRLAFPVSQTKWYT